MEDPIFQRGRSWFDRLFVELLTVEVVICIITNFLFIVLVLMFKQLRKSASYQILLHINFFQAVLSFGTPFTWFQPLVMNVTDTRYVSLPRYRVICFFIEVEISLFLGVYLFLVLLLVNWYLKVYKDEKYEKFCKVYKYVIAAIYVFLIVFEYLLITYSRYGDYYSHLTGYVTCLVLVVLTIIVVIINIFHRIKSRHFQQVTIQDNGLPITNIVILLTFPIVLLLRKESFGMVQSDLMGQTALILGFASPIFNTLYLYLYDKHFSASFKKLFKGQCRSSENLQDTNPVPYRSRANEEPI